MVSNKIARTPPLKRWLMLARGGNAVTFFDAARHLILTKGTDAHDFKFAASAVEDFTHASPNVRPQLLAASIFYLKGSRDGDSPLLQRARGALASL